MQNLKKIRRTIKRKLGLIPPSFEETLAPEVQQTAQAIISKHDLGVKNKALFIDMGSNVGQGFEYFSQFYSPDYFDYWLLEANPYCMEPLQKNVLKRLSKLNAQTQPNFMNIAVSNNNGTLKLYGLTENKRKSKTSVGASTVKDHNTIYYQSEEDAAIDVPARKASELINEANASHPVIVLKVDIETAEYDVLEDLIESQLISSIEHFYVEWHTDYMSADVIDTYKDREQKIKSSLGSKLTDWR